MHIPVEVSTQEEGPEAENRVHFLTFPHPLVSALCPPAKKKTNKEQDKNLNGRI